MNVCNGVRKDDSETCSFVRLLLLIIFDQIGRSPKTVRLHNLFLASLVAANLAHADDVQVPVLADGSADLEKVFGGFELAFPVNSNGGQSTDFTGEMLGEVFSGHVLNTETAEHFYLSVDAPTLSEHGNFLVAVLATEAICLRNGLAPGRVLWQDTKARNGTAWEVSTSCSTPKN